MTRGEARASEGCTCPPEWFKPVKPGEDRTGHHPDCAIEQERLAGEAEAVHTRGNGETPVHGAAKKD